MQSQGGWRVRVREGDVRMEAEVRVMPFEDGGRGHKPGNAGGLWEVELARKRILLEPPKEPALPVSLTSDFCPLELRQSLGCFKPLSMW